MKDEAAPKVGLWKRVLTYGVTLVVAAIAIYGISEFLTPFQPPKPGDCAALTGDLAEGAYHWVECAAPNANYLALETVPRSQACPSDQDWDWLPSRGIDPKVRLCLAPIYDEGECYTEVRQVWQFDVVDCGDSSSFKVTKVGRDAPTTCAQGEKARAYPEIRLTYCLSR